MLAHTLFHVPDKNVEDTRMVYFCPTHIAVVEPYVLEGKIPHNLLVHDEVKHM